MNKFCRKALIGLAISILLVGTTGAADASVPNTSSKVVSWYGGGFHGRKTANGETYNMYANTAASNSHKMGTRLQVTNPKNGKSAIVKVNDTGGFGKYGRVLDLSRGAFAQIAPLGQGTWKVNIKVLK